MSNSSTSNSELKKFVKKAAVRALFFLGLLFVVFALPLPRSYYFSIPEKTDYSKISWVEDKLNHTTQLDSTVVFMGSSLCFYGVDDSLLNSLDSSSTQYLNLGFRGHCFAIVDALIEDMLVNRKLRPKKVYLSYRGDGQLVNVDLHPMYPITSSPSQILASAKEKNMLIVPTFLKRVAWNVDAINQHFKFFEENDSLHFASNYGYEKRKDVDSLEVEKKYQELLQGTKAAYDLMEKWAGGQNMGIKTKITLARLDYLNNLVFQKNSLRRSARMLDEYGVDYDIVIYPNLILSRTDKADVLINYVKNTFPEIDYSKHEVIAFRDSIFRDARYYVDVNHVNDRGAKALTRILYERNK